MNELDTVLDIIERIQRIGERAEQAALSISKIIDAMEGIEELIEENNNV